ncbi:MAG: ABC transporter ATP-binding protein [Candidatus Aminicenantales bacterium]
MDTVLRITNLHKSFKTGFIPRRKKILKGISLEVQRGEIFGYLGPNGAGKTTTLKCALGLLFPEEGNVEIFGHPHSSPEAREKIGYLPENPYFYDYLTAEEFLRFYSDIAHMGREEKQEQIPRLLELVGLRDVADLQLRKFSRGMLQRIGFAQALINNPSLVFLDEPLGGLDPLGRKEMRDVIVSLKDEGKTVFLSSHILQDIEMICDRVAILVEGRVINQGRLQDLVSEKIVFTEVVVSGIPEEELEAFGKVYAPQEERVLLKVFDEEKLPALLQRLQEKNGRLHSLIPRTQTLEDIFVGAVKTR